MVVVDHKFGRMTRYAHLSKFNVRAGKSVQRGDVILKTEALIHMGFQLLRENPCIAKRIGDEIEAMVKDLARLNPNLFL